MKTSKANNLVGTPHWQGILGSGLVFGLLMAADQLSMHYGLDGSERIADDVLGGLLAGVLVYFYERHRRRLVTEKLRVIDLMNHHIRNALQPVVFVAHESESTAHAKIVAECVNRIDWALREILPGKSEEEFTEHTR
jgi:hypothetical protein